jgi:phenylacetate-CoA ligase
MDRKRSAHPLPIPLSAVEGVVWPAATGGTQAMALAALHELEHSQYLPPEEMRRRQFLQAGHLLAHAAKTMPFWRERLRMAGVDPAKPLDDESWAKLPILTRREVQDGGTALHCAQLPAQHGQTTTDTTSGSTGAPITVKRSALALFYWNVFALREAIWHDIDFSGKLAAIRIDWSRPAGSTGIHVAHHANWGSPIGSHFPTGPAAVLDVRHSTIADHAAFILAEAPSHLVGFGGALEALARYCLAYGIRVPSIRSVYSQGEVLSATARTACRDAWGVEVIDDYSTVEAGYLATQCPEHPHLHVHAENAIVEILRPDGSPSSAGEVGCVVVTTLHNFAMPLIRYAVGDLAEAGAPCACGRTLPVITRVIGRERPRMLKLPGGGEAMPAFGSRALAAFPGIIAHQVVQRCLDAIEIRLVVRALLQAEDEARLRDLVVRTTGHPFRVDFVYVDAIERGPGGKFVEFLCEIAD